MLRLSCNDELVSRSETRTITNSAQEWDGVYQGGKQRKCFAADSNAEQLIQCFPLRCCCCCFGVASREECVHHNKVALFN